LARSLRVEYEGAFYHVISRGNDRKEIFIDDADRRRFLKYIKELVSRYGIRVHVWCLMNNHYHLVIETPLGNLSKVMHTLNTSYTVYFNHRHKRAGHLFQGRYKAVLVQADEYLHHLSRYIHLNPLRAKIVKDPKEYIWSSYSDYVFKEKKEGFLTTEFILEMFNNHRKEAKRLYEKFVVEGIGNEVEIIKKDMTRGIILGKANFVNWVKNEFLVEKKDKEVPALRQLKGGVGIEWIKAEVKKRVENEKSYIKICIYLIRKYSDKKLTEIATLFGKISYSGISQICRRMEKEKRKDKKMDLLIADIVRKMSNVKI